MFARTLTVLAFCSFATIAYAQYYPYQVRPYYPPVVVEPYVPPIMVEPDEPDYAPVQPQYKGSLSKKCALASEYIRKNNCGPQGCDIGLCIALQNGCRINSWGHICPWR